MILRSVGCHTSAGKKVNCGWVIAGLAKAQSSACKGAVWGVSAMALSRAAVTSSRVRRRGGGGDLCAGIWGGLKETRSGQGDGK